jgi:arginase family enzyme
MNWVEGFLFFLSPVNEGIASRTEGTIGATADVHTHKHIPDVEQADLLLLGIQAAGQTHGMGNADMARRRFYSLFHHGPPVRIADLGNLSPSGTDADDETALKEVLEPLVSRGKTVVVIGGSQQFTFPIYLAFESLETTVNIAVIDSVIDMGEFRESLGPDNWLSKVVLHEPGYLFNLSVLGYQTYYNDPETIALMDKLFFDAVRLGTLCADLRDAEPVLRNADILSFDLRAIRNSDAPGTHQPNGFNGEQACQLARYAGLSEKSKCIGFFHFHATNDTTGQWATLLAQMLWYVLDGFSRRVKEFPLIQKNDFIEYKVLVPGGVEELVFYKSIRTDKWWLNVPYQVRGTSGKPRPHLLPCTYKDYETACAGEVPDTFWKTYQKLT